MNYEAPTIGDSKSLKGSLGDASQNGLGSDAAIKHGVEPVESAYQAPEISAKRELDGRLQLDSLRPA